MSIGFVVLFFSPSLSKLSRMMTHLNYFDVTSNHFIFNSIANKGSSVKIKQEEHISVQQETFQFCTNMVRVNTATFLYQHTVLRK